MIGGKAGCEALTIRSASARTWSTCALCVSDYKILSADSRTAITYDNGARELRLVAEPKSEPVLSPSSSPFMLCEEAASTGFDDGRGGLVGWTVVAVAAGTEGVNG